MEPRFLLMNVLWVLLLASSHSVDAASSNKPSEYDYVPEQSGDILLRNGGSAGIPNMFQDATRLNDIEEYNSRYESSDSLHALKQNGNFKTHKRSIFDDGGPVYQDRAESDFGRIKKRSLENVVFEEFDAKDVNHQRHERSIIDEDDVRHKTDVLGEKLDGFHFLAKRSPHSIEKSHLEKGSAKPLEKYEDITVDGNRKSSSIDFKDETDDNDVFHRLVKQSFEGVKSEDVRRLVKRSPHMHFSDVAEDDPEYNAKVEEAVKKWESNFARIRKAMAEGIKMAMPYFMDSVTNGDMQMSPACRHALFQWIADLRSLKPYALRMADASAKMMNGILTGTLSSFGSYDQCVETREPKRNIRGQYCTIESWPPLPPKPRFYPLNQRLEAFKRFENNTGAIGEFTKYLQLFYIFPLRLGICVPSACSREDMFNVSTMVVKRFFPLNVTVPRCEVKNELVIENYQIPMFCVGALLTALVIIGTATDILLRQKEKDTNYKPTERSYTTKCVLAWSAVSNWEVLLDTRSGADDLSVLHGVRFFSMLWIIFGHTYFHLNFNVLKYLQITIELTSQFFFNSITNASLLVDNFFFMSGLLVIYIGVDISNKTGKIPNPFYFLVHRIWRFLPIQMFFVGIATLLPLLGDGPMWHENIDPIVDGCRKDWWANFLFINNLYRSTSKGCLSYSWYLASDFQVYVFCIPIILTVMTRPRLGLWLNFVVMVLSVIGAGVHNYVRNLPPALLFTRADIEQRNDLMMETYYPPLHHLGPHCLGLFVGYYLRTKRSPKNLHWGVKALLWVIAFTLTSCALFGVHNWNVGGPGTGVVATVLYASLARMAWTTGLAWIVIACSTGCGGFLASILQWKPFVPFSRLTFMVYMVHPLVQHTFYSTLREGIQARNSLALFVYCGFTIASYVLALVCCLLLEAPLVRLGKVVFEMEEAIRKGKITLRQLCFGGPRRSEAAGEVYRNGWTPDNVPPLANVKGIPNVPACNGKISVESTCGRRDIANVPACNERVSEESFVCRL